MRTEELEGMARYLVNGGAKPKFFKPRIDPLLLIIGSLIPPVLWLTMPKNRLVKEARPTRFTLPIVLGWSGLLGACAFFLLWSAETQSYRGGDEMAGLYMIGAILSAFAFVTGVVMASRRPRLIALPSQSLRTPRHEFLVDSWHVSVPEAGKEFAQFKQRIVNAISNLDPSIEINEELHQQLSPRGFDERMRHVLTKGQANVHVHVYPYGRDAFVGWDGYLNFARWAETEPISKNIQSGARVEYRSLTTGVHVPTEFDLMELNALSETVHRAMVHEIEAFLKEREIEADLDFTIIRGDRERAMIAGKEYERDAGGTTQKHYFGRRRM
jgi:hypothetical protein